MLLVSEKGKSLKGLKDDFGLLDFIIAEAIGKVKAVSSEMFIRNFQFKILRKTVFTNSRPIKIGFQMIFVPFVEVSICHSNERLPRFLQYRIEWKKKRLL